ncbi:MAG: hypothetical protein ABSF91_13705 [Bacteroidota bacterium]
MTKERDNSSSIKVQFISLSPQWLGVLCVSLLAYACSVPPTNSARITAMDIKSQNIEKIRGGLEYLLGNDSTGIAAMDYVRSFEDRISDFYPKDKNTVGTNLAPPPDNRAIARLYPPASTGSTTVQENQERSRTQIYASFGKEMLRTSRLRLNEGYESCLASGNIASAKIGFAAGYVALTLTPSVADLEEIQNKMVRLLDSLTVKR